MVEEIVRAVLENAEKLTLSVVLILLVLLVFAAVVSDKLVGPKTVDGLRSQIKSLETECVATETEKAKAALELADARVLMAEAKVRIEWYEERFRDAVAARDACLRQKERLEIELEVRRGSRPPTETGA